MPTRNANSVAARRELRPNSSAAKIAAALREVTRNKVFNAGVDPHWFAGSTRFWYRNDLPEGGREYVLVDAANGTRGPAFDHARLAKALQEAGVAGAQSERLLLESLSFVDELQAVLFRTGDKGWRCNLQTYELSAATVDAELVPALASRNGP